MTPKETASPIRGHFGGMDLGELFRLPEGSRIASFAEAQVRLYRHDPSLQDYFLPLQLSFGSPCSGNGQRRSIAASALDFASTGAYRVTRPFGRRKYKVDVLLCPMPYFERPMENRFLIRALTGLAETGASIMCLIPDTAPCRAEIVSRLEAEGRSKQVVLLDPRGSLNPVAGRLLSLTAQNRGRAALRNVIEVLRPFGLEPALDIHLDFERIARFVEAWDSLADFVEFDAVVARCHWHMLCSPVCRTAQRRGKPVITFQQGVIDHTLDVPVSASHYVAFGRSSAGFLERMNRSFFKAVGTNAPAVNFVPGGSLFDKLLDLPDQFAKQTLLVIHDYDPSDFYGLDPQRRGILALITRLLESGTPPRRIIIRPHPYWPSVELEPWKQLAREHPDSCEISHSAWTLEDDLRRASAVVGNYSGALTVAAGSGLPTYFVEADGFSTGDLACFGQGQTFSPGEAFREIKLALSNSQTYQEARANALGNAREYYANGGNVNPDSSFFERMLWPTRERAVQSNVAAR